MSKNNIHVLARGVVIDEHHILLCQTLDLPIPFYFLPGGHIEHAESATDAVLREFKEEAGVQCTIKRFLGCLEHSFESGHNSICHNHEYNFIFEVTCGDLKVSNPIPRLEKHIELLWVKLDKLNEIDFRPEPLKGLLNEWLQLAPNKVFASKMK